MTINRKKSSPFCDKNEFIIGNYPVFKIPWSSILIFCTVPDVREKILIAGKII
jgi:hypothetical protein